MCGREQVLQSCILWMLDYKTCPPFTVGIHALLVLTQAARLSSNPEAHPAARGMAEPRGVRYAAGEGPAGAIEEIPD